MLFKASILVLSSPLRSHGFFEAVYLLSIRNR